MIIEGPTVDPGLTDNAGGGGGLLARHVSVFLGSWRPSRSEGRRAAALLLSPKGDQGGYGHPSDNTLGRLAAGGARSFRTDRDGDIALVHRGAVLHAVGRRGPGMSPS